MRARKILQIVGTHAEGEIGNVVVGGVIDVPGTTAFEKMEHLRDHQDELRRSLVFEPRGAVNHAVNLLLPTSNPEADLAFIILEATKYPMMSGSNTMCVATVVLETGIRPIQEPFTKLVLEAPGGLVEARCHCEDGRVRRVELTMLPSFVLERHMKVDVAGLGKVDLAVAYGGIFYAITSAQELALPLGPDDGAEIVRVGIAIRDAVNKSFTAVHPENPKIRGVANVIVAGAITRSSDGKNETVSATVIGNGRLDRSPCGTGVAARMALLHSDGLMAEGEELINRSIFGTEFRSSIISRTTAGALHAVIAKVSGRAWITSVGQAIIDPDDPLANGHCPSDIWVSRG